MGRKFAYLSRAIDNPYVPPPIVQLTVLLLHLDGLNASTVITDSALGGDAPHTVTAEGNAQLTTGDKKFGSASLVQGGVVPRNLDRLSIPDSTDFDLGIGGEEFTLELFTRALYADTQHPMIGRGSGDPADWALVNGNQYVLQFQSPPAGLTTQIYWYYNKAGVAAWITVPAANFRDGVWHHVAVSHDGTTTRIFYDGVMGGSTTDAYSRPANSSLFEIAGFPGSATYSRGNIDEVRILKGVGAGIYTANFTPPTGPFTPDL